jgi:hypothetical protein
VIGTEGTKTPAGVQGLGRPTGAKRRGGSRAARGKRSAWSGNLRPHLPHDFPYKVE